MKNSALHKKVLGCLAAGAIGDQLGRPVENWNYPDIDEKYGRLTDPWQGLEGGDCNFDVGTDDTALGQILCHTYIKKGGRITIEDYARQWLEEFQPTKFFFCMRNTFELLKAGYSPRITGGLNIVTGSGLMAINPVGIYNACYPHDAYADACEIASMYQRDLDVYIPGVIAAAIAEAFRPGATAESVCAKAIEIAPDAPMITFDHRKYNNLKATIEKAVEIGSAADDVFSAREGLYAELLQYHPIDPQEVFAMTFGIFAASGGDTEQAILGGANIGRDADTISSLNGQLTGALNGADTIPARWFDGLKSSTNAGPFLKTAEQMAELVEKKLAEAEKNSAELRKLC